MWLAVLQPSASMERLSAETRQNGERSDALQGPCRKGATAAVIFPYYLGLACVRCMIRCELSCGGVVDAG